MKYNAILFAIIFFGCASATKQNERAEQPGGEKYRPQFHFSPPAQWMNDPNGMVYYEGEYHLFYQHYPDSSVWGPMHWGHAVSPDMVHWQHLPIALYPDSLGYIFSGSAVIDKDNTSGFGTEENPAMIAIFTYSDPIGAKAGRNDFQTQGIAYSLDKGRTWVKYEGNPVLESPGIADFRDPKVIWNESTGKWVMVLAVKDKVSIYSSADLKTWEFESDFGSDLGAHGGVWECPDLFPLTNENGETKWVMLVSINPGAPNGGSATQYFVGDFDGSSFTPDDSVTRWMDYGTDNYAGVTWSDVPESDGRRLLIGWMNNWQYANTIPTKGWRGANTVPRELKLDGMSLKSVPVKELASLRKEAVKFDMQKEEWELPASLMEIELEVNASEGEQFQVVFSNDQGEEVVIELAPGELSVDRSGAGVDDFNGGFAKIHKAPLISAPEQVKIYLDLSSVEIFVNDGATVMTELVFPDKPYNKLQVKGDKSMVSGITGHVLTSIWRKDSQQETQVGL